MGMADAIARLTAELGMRLGMSRRSSHTTVRVDACSVPDALVE